MSVTVPALKATLEFPYLVFSLAAVLASGDQPAFEHFVGDGASDLVDECGAHLRVVS